MSLPSGRGPAEFEPVRLGGRRRRIDPAALGVALVIGALVLAIVKPWDTASPEVAAVPSGAPPAGPTASPTAQPTTSARDPMVAPTWSDIRTVVRPRDDWGIRTILIAAPGGQPTPAPLGYAERWAEVKPGGAAEAGTATVDEAEGPIIALGVTFPPNETPLDVRIWAERDGGEFEWMDARPVDDVPARGAYLYVRRGSPDRPVQVWPPGRYRVDVLVGGGIQRIAVAIRDRSGRLPDPGNWPEEGPPVPPFESAGLAGLPPGLFVQADGVATALRSAAGPRLGEAAAWLDIDPAVDASGPTEFVERTYQPGITQLGVVLPAYSTIRSASVGRLAPFEDRDRARRQTSIGTLSPVSFVAFGPALGGTWRPGVYAISVAWDDADGAHDRTWHVELRPGPVGATPLLLAATRAWAGFAGSNGVLLGATEPLSGTDPLGVRLLEIAPQTEPGYPGLGGSNLIGCGATVVLGAPEVIGIVGPKEANFAPVAARILYPFANEGPLDVLTAAGAVPGLSLVAPQVTAEFGGTASYGFQAGTGDDAAGYSICIGLAANGG